MPAPAGEQLNVLCERYLDIVMSERGNTLLLLLQAPLIALFVVLNWRDVDQSTDSLYYLLAFASLWFGTSAACREVVKEAPMLRREVRQGLHLAAYLCSKLLVLALLSFVQCLLLAILVDRWVPLGGPVLGHFLLLWLTSLGGISLGLWISSLMSNSDKAVGMVILALIPQMVFSEMVLSHENASNLVLWLEDFSLVSWSFQGLKELTESDWSAITLLQSASMLLLLAAVLWLLAYSALRWRVRR